MSRGRPLGSSTKKRRFQGRGDRGTGYRQAVAYVRRAVSEGSISPHAGAQLVKMIQAEMEMWMIEAQLKRAGVDFSDTSVIMGQLAPYREKKVTTKTGVDKEGRRVDEKAVSLKGGEGDPYLEADAESENL